MQKTERSKNIRCSFCGKSQSNVRKIIAGPNVFICDECISVCNKIIDDEFLDDEVEYNIVDEKIPRHLRDEVPLVCDGHHVMWVVGHRVSEYYKISENTTRVLEVVYGGITK